MNETGKLRTSGTVPEVKGLSRMVRLMVVISGLALSLGACGGLQVGDQHAGKLGPTEQQQLNSSLSVASASAEAGQTGAAERLYTELSRHYPSAPEPRLGLAYLALEAGDFTRAGRHFAEADERSTGPAAKAEALLGAGRASLGEGDVAGAKARFLAASGLAKGTPSEAWVANGIGVVATLEGDHERARKHFDEAVKLSSSHPIITANLVRALAQSGETDEARQLYAKYAASHWLGSDAADLSHLLEKAVPKSGAAAASPSGRQVQLFSARSRSAAVAAWSRLSIEEKDLLGGLSSRVVKAEVPKKGVFYRLRAGPLADKAAAKRLCGLLKGRGRDCFVPTGKWTGGTGDGVQETVRAAGKEPARAAVAALASGGQVQLFSARSRSAAVAAWIRLSLEEKELLGGLSSRVVKAEVPKKGVFYRLRAGPLADKAAARRLCGLLKGRGRDCFVPAGKWIGGTGDGAQKTVRPAGKEPARATAAASASGGQVQLFSARSRSAAVAAWIRLSLEEKELLGGLSPRVVKAEVPKKGVFYRLRAGPLADRAAARRLCGLLKGRGRDCFVPAGKWNGGK